MATSDNRPAPIPEKLPLSLLPLFIPLATLTPLTHSCAIEMTQPIEIKVPDIGDFHDVSVIEVLVKPGDKVEKETPLIALETDKATMEVPSPHGRRGEGSQCQGE